MSLQIPLRSVSLIALAVTSLAGSMGQHSVALQPRSVPTNPNVDQILFLEQGLDGNGLVLINVDGTQLAFAVNGDVSVMNSDGSSFKQITTGKLLDDGASVLGDTLGNAITWTPDGRIAFLAIEGWADGPAGVYTIKPDGT